MKNIINIMMQQLTLFL